jgi:hypothetical protein
LRVRHPALARPIRAAAPLYMLPDQALPPAEEHNQSGPTPGAPCVTSREASAVLGGTPLMDPPGTVRGVPQGVSRNVTGEAAFPPPVGARGAEVVSHGTLEEPQGKGARASIVDPAADLWEGRPITPPLSEQQVSLIRQAARRRSLGLDPPPGSNPAGLVSPTGFVIYTINYLVSFFVIFQV